MEFILAIVNQYLAPCCALIFTVLLGTLGYALKLAAQKYLDTDVKRDIARDAFAFVEQVWKTIHGHDKMVKALEVAEILLRKKGISFDAEETEILIEAAVNEFNSALKAPMTAEDTAAAVRRVEQAIE